MASAKNSSEEQGGGNTLHHAISPISGGRIRVSEEERCYR